MAGLRSHLLSTNARPCAHSCHPCAAKCFAVALPIPELDPVMTIVFMLFPMCKLLKNDRVFSHFSAKKERLACNASPEDFK